MAHLVVDRESVRGRLNGERPIVRNQGSQVWITTGKVSPLIPFGKYAKNDRSVTKYGEGEAPVIPRSESTGATEKSVNEKSKSGFRVKLGERGATGKSVNGE